MYNKKTKKRERETKNLNNETININKIYLINIYHILCK